MQTFKNIKAVKAIKAIIHTLLPVLFLHSCNNTPEKLPLKEKEIERIHFFLDNSASMGGYMSKGTEFKTILSDLTTKIESNIKPMDINFISAQITPFSGDAAKFSTEMATTPIADKDGYQLHKMIETIAAHTDSNDISLLVSDCILSFADSIIEAHPDINRTDAPTALKSNIYSTFKKLKDKKKMAASLYAFKSSFYGKYYNYLNDDSDFTKQGINRPFYILVIGNKDLLAKFNSQLAAISTFQPLQSLQFGLNEEPVSAFDILPQVERKGEWIKSTELAGLDEIEYSKNEPLQFCAVLNLDNLPAYANNVAYLQSNLKAETKGCEVTYTVKKSDQLDRSKLKSTPQLAAMEEATHGLLFQLKSMNLKEATVHITLPMRYDTWYDSWSCTDDTDLSKTGGQTFALQYFIAGIKEAYESDNKNYIDFKITLKQ